MSNWLNSQESGPNFLETADRFSALWRQRKSGRREFLIAVDESAPAQRTYNALRNSLRHTLQGMQSMGLCPIQVPMRLERATMGQGTQNPPLRTR
jgi:hypothetical protein